MFKTLVAAILLALAGSASAGEQKISSLAIGLYQPNQKAMLGPAFINAVNRYLSRYEPRLIQRETDHVTMQVDYDYEYAVELRVNEQEYEISVTLVEKTSRHGKAQKAAAKLAAGVHKTMENQLRRR